MSEGLIGGLHPYCFAVCMDDPDSPGFEDHKTPLVSKDDVLALLRSDETVEAVARAIFGSEGHIAPWDDWAAGVDGLDPTVLDTFRDIAKDVLRVLAGDPTDSGAAK